MLSGGKTQQNHLSIETSGSEGQSLRKLEKLYEDLAASEARINMMDKLATYKVGFNNVENFNLGRIFNSKTLNNDELGERERDDKKVVETAM